MKHENKNLSRTYKEESRQIVKLFAVIIILIDIVRIGKVLFLK